MRVSICIITYKRTYSLKKLLESITKLTFKKCKHPEITVVVVDNDIKGESYNYCRNISKFYRWPLKAFIESKRGISYARNTAIGYGKKYGDYIAVIDDDEIVAPSWLDEMISTMDKYEADVVTGPNLPLFLNNAPSWVIKGKFFIPKRHETGKVLDTAATNNVFFNVDIVKQIDKPFDERFALSGGEDTHFFRLVNERGFKIVWADEALVYERIPEYRMTMKWIITRVYRSSITYTISKILIKSYIRILPRRISVAFIRIIIGIIQVIVMSLVGKHGLVKGLINIASGLGTISAFIGIRYEEYKKIHGE